MTTFNIIGILATLIIVSLIVYGIVQVRGGAAFRKKMKKALDEIFDFKTDKYFISVFSQSAIAVDNTRKKVCFLGKDNQPIIYNLSQIKSCEIIQEIKTNDGKSSLLIGGVKVDLPKKPENNLSKNIKTVKNLGIKVTINTYTNPTFTIIFLASASSMLSNAYNFFYDLTEKWCELLASENFGVSQSFGSSEILSAEQQAISVADELQKLKSLVNEGTLTWQEFEQQKAKLLNL